MPTQRCGKNFMPDARSAWRRLAVAVGTVCQKRRGAIWRPQLELRVGNGKDGRDNVQEKRKRKEKRK